MRHSHHTATRRSKAGPGRTSTASSVQGEVADPSASGTSRTGTSCLPQGRSLVAPVRSRPAPSSDGAEPVSTTGTSGGPASAACPDMARAAQAMFESLFTHRPTIKRYLAEPLLDERLRYLAHCQDAGVSRHLLQRHAVNQLRLVGLLNLQPQKAVTLSQIEAAAAKWSVPDLPLRSDNGGSGSTKEQFICHAVQWVRHLGWFQEPPKPPPHPNTNEVAAFVEWARTVRGHSEASIESYCQATNDLLVFLAESEPDVSFALIAPGDIDRYFVAKAAHQTFGRRTIANRASNLRTFFRFAEDQGWCRRGIADSIKGPRTFDGEPLLPRLSRTDALRLLDTTDGDCPFDIRDRAILKLLIGYGLRSGEVRTLLLDQFDWRNDRLWVRHSKSGKPDWLPLQTGAANAVARYILEVRPSRPDRFLFYTLTAPIRPLERGGFGSIVRRRIRRLGIVTEKSGPHAIRHATAQNLLDEGMSLKEIGDFLGHTSLESTRIYARHDLRSLREVARFDLGGLG